MDVIYHPLVKQDITDALKYYTKISPRLADEFEREIRSIISQTGKTPLRFHLTGMGFRRANLRRFPYHVLYEIRANFVRVMLVRHNKRHPNYHLERK